MDKNRLGDYKTIQDYASTPIDDIKKNELMKSEKAMTRAINEEKFAKENAPLEDSSDVIFDVAPAGLLAGIASKIFGKKVLGSAANAMSSKDDVASSVGKMIGKEVSQKTKYPEELYSYHADAAKKLGYGNVDDMYDDFYNKFDMQGEYTDRAFSKIKDYDSLTPTNIMKTSFDEALKDLEKGKSYKKGYSNRRDMLQDRRIENSKIRNEDKYDKLEEQELQQRRIDDDLIDISRARESVKEILPLVK